MPGGGVKVCEFSDPSACFTRVHLQVTDLRNVTAYLLHQTLTAKQEVFKKTLVLFCFTFVEGCPARVDTPTSELESDSDSGP